MVDFLFSSESVSEGHPDKLCDQISDAVLDAVLAEDPKARVACEALAKSGLIVLAGEVSSAAKVDFESVVRRTVNSVGYNNAVCGFDGNSCGVINLIGQQSSDIAVGVDRDENDILLTGAGDQGIMFGFACDETDVLMPAPITYAHRLVRKQAELRRGGMDWLRPDAKSQVTFRYVDNKIKSIDTIVFSTQHDEGVTHKQVEEGVVEEIIKKVIPENLRQNTVFHVNPTGRFVTGGPVGDCGLTGRKIIVDTYGGSAKHGGGAFSGKDPTKVDRSAAYAARYVAKNIVAAGLASVCEIQIAYSIGIPAPVSLRVDTRNTNTISEKKIVEIINQVFDFRPGYIIKKLDLIQPVYQKTAAYGHFGREDLNVPWERLDLVEAIKNLL